MRRVLEARVGAQSGDEGLLEAVLGVVGADRRDQEPEHVGAVLVEQRLKRGKGLIGHSPTKRLTPGFRETVPRMEIDSDTRELVARALLEDLGSGDVTAEAVVPEDASGRATITQKEAGVVFGLDVAAEVFRQAGAGGLESLAERGRVAGRRPGDGRARRRSRHGRCSRPSGRRSTSSATSPAWRR